MDLDPIPFLNVLVLVLDATGIQLVLVLLLLFCSAIISGAEVAFFSLQIKSLEDPEGSEITPAIQRVISLLKNPKRLLATILVANNFINIAIVLLFSSLSKTFFEFLENPIVLLIVEIGIITSVILIFGEILPKIYANRNALTFSTKIAPMIRFWTDFYYFGLHIQ